MTERVFCPKHWKYGTLKVKTISGKRYAYCHHWHIKQAIDCYLGPLDVFVKKHGVNDGRGKVKSKGVV